MADELEPKITFTPIQPPGFSQESFLESIRQGGIAGGDDHSVANFIVAVEKQRMNVLGDDYEIFEDEHWPGATKEERDEAREVLEEL